jgi:biotin transport system substrate-specific component
VVDQKSFSFAEFHMISITSNGLAGASLEPFFARSIALRALAVVVGVALLAGLSQIAHGEPVPKTMQTFGVVLIGLTYGWRMAGLTLLAYLGVGAAGLPVFAQASGGAGVFAGFSGGYLLGFLGAAVFMGWCADRALTRSWLGAFLVGLAGLGIVFIPGMIWMAYLKDFEFAYTWGFAPFILWDAAKLVLAVLIVKGVLKGFDSARFLK